MTKEEIEQAVEYRSQGKTWAEIGTLLNYSASNVQYIVSRMNKPKIRRFEKVYQETPYKGWYEYFNDDKTRSISTLCMDIWGYWCKQHNYLMQRMITGQNVKFPVKDILKLEQVTGRKISELFEERAVE